MTSLKRTQLFALIAVALIALCSCGGGSLSGLPTEEPGIDSNPAPAETAGFEEQFANWVAAQQGSEGTPQSAAGEAIFDDMPPLPLEWTEDGKGVSAESSGDGSVVVPGKDFIAGNGTTVEGFAVELHVEAGSDIPAYALYKISGLQDTRPHSLNVECIPDFGQTYWIGIANYSDYRWDWFGPITLPEYELMLSGHDSSYVTALGNMYFITAVRGGMTATHYQSTLLFGPNEPPSEPGCPHSLSASDGEFAEGIGLTWEPGHGAQWYRIFRAPALPSEENEDLRPGDFQFIGESEGTTYFDDDEIVPGKRYFYKVQARNDTGLSCFSNIDVGWAKEGGGGNEFHLEAFFIEDHQAVKLEWTDREDFLGFDVYRSVWDGPFVRLGETANNYWIDDNEIECGTEYNYKVRAWFGNSEEQTVWSNVATVFCENEHGDEYVIEGVLFEVWEEQELPISGALVTLFGPGGKQTTESGVEGGFRFGDLMPGRYIVYPFKPAFRFDGNYRVVELGGENTVKVVEMRGIEVNQTSRLQGFVYEQFEGEGGVGVEMVGGALIEIDKVESELSWTVETDANGFYQKWELPNGGYWITPSKAGYEFNPAAHDAGINGESVVPPLYFLADWIGEGGGGEEGGGGGGEGE